MSDLSCGICTIWPEFSLDIAKQVDVTSKSGLGGWVAQSVKHPTSARVMTPRFVGSRPAWGSVLTAQSLEPASDSLPESPQSPTRGSNPRTVAS